MTNPHSPLDDNHLAQINTALDSIARAEAQIVMAKQAGINVDEAEKQLTANRDKLMTIKRVYFPMS